MARASTKPAEQPTHTPGPWTFVSGDLEIRAAYATKICTINEYAFNCGADALLIAAAPDLLEALATLLLHGDDEARKQAYAAIGKATGVS